MNPHLRLSPRRRCRTVALHEDSGERERVRTVLDRDLAGPSSRLDVTVPLEGLFGRYLLRVEAAGASGVVRREVALVVK